MTHWKALFLREPGKEAPGFGTWGFRVVPPALPILVSLLQTIRKPGDPDPLLSVAAVTGMFLFGIAATLAPRDMFGPQGWLRTIDMMRTTRMRAREIFLVRLAAAGLPF